MLREAGFPGTEIAQGIRSVVVWCEAAVTVGSNASELIVTITRDAIGG